MGREEETGFSQNRSSLESSKAETRTCEKINVAVVDAQQIENKVQRFCFINIRPKHSLAAKSIIQDSVKLLGEMDQRLLQISENLRDKAIDREKVISRLNNLRNYSLGSLKERIDGKKNLLILLYKALDNMSFPNSCSILQEKIQKHKLNFRMQHKMKSLAQEKTLFRDINVSQETNNNDSTLTMEELSDIIWQIKRKYVYHHRHYNQNKCEKLDEEIKQFKVTRKISEGLKETLINQVKVICDELMETRKEKRELEAKIKVAEKELEAINKEIWSFHQKNAKGKHKRKEASLYFIKNTGIEWVFKFCNLEKDSIHSNTIFSANLDQVMSIFSDKFPPVEM